VCCLCSLRSVYFSKGSSSIDRITWGGKSGSEEISSWSPRWREGGGEGLEILGDAGELEVKDNFILHLSPLSPPVAQAAQGALKRLSLSVSLISLDMRVYTNVYAPWTRSLPSPTSTQITNGTDVLHLARHELLVLPVASSGYPDIPFHGAEGRGTRNITEPGADPVLQTPAK